MLRATVYDGEVHLPGADLFYVNETYVVDVPETIRTLPASMEVTILPGLRAGAAGASGRRTATVCTVPIERPARRIGRHERTDGGPTRLWPPLLRRLLLRHCDRLLPAPLDGNEPSATFGGALSHLPPSHANDVVVAAVIRHRPRTCLATPPSATLARSRSADVRRTQLMFFF